MTLAEFGAGKNVVTFHWTEKSGENFCVKYRARSPSGTLRILKKFRAATKKVNLESKFFSMKEIVQHSKPFSYKWLAGVTEFINIKSDDLEGKRTEISLYRISSTDNQN